MWTWSFTTLTFKKSIFSLVRVQILSNNIHAEIKCTVWQHYSKKYTYLKSYNLQATKYVMSTSFYFERTKWFSSCLFRITVKAALPVFLPIPRPLCRQIRWDFLWATFQLTNTRAFFFFLRPERSFSSNQERRGERNVEMYTFNISPHFANLQKQL